MGFYFIQIRSTRKFTTQYLRLRKCETYLKLIICLKNKYVTQYAAIEILLINFN